MDFCLASERCLGGLTRLQGSGASIQPASWHPAQQREFGFGKGVLIGKSGNVTTCEFVYATSIFKSIYVSTGTTPRVEPRIRARRLMSLAVSRCVALVPPLDNSHGTMDLEQIPPTLEIPSHIAFAFCDGVGDGCLTGLTG